MSGMRSVDYIDSFCESVDIIISERIKKISFDNTIICTIVNDQDSKNGKYQVSDGSIKFDAYSDSDKYRAGDQVRVSILQGDFSKKKYIVGKSVDKDNQIPLTYVSPLDTIIDITGNIIDEGYRSTGIIANGTVTEGVFWNSGTLSNLQKNDIYSTITLKADFTTLFYDKNIKSGTYGLRLTLQIKPSVDSENYIYRQMELNSGDMFGDPYAYVISTQQAKTFPLETEGFINAIQLSIFQNNDFINANGKEIAAAVEPNILVSDIELGFGSDLSSIEDNVLKIYCEDELSYQEKNLSDEATNPIKTLGLVWYNKDADNQYIGFSDGLYDIDYDEITYLEKGAAEHRLLAQLGKENVGTDKLSLDLSATLEEDNARIKNVSNLISTDLANTLRSFQIQLSGLTTVQNGFVKLLQTNSNDEGEEISLLKFLETLSTKWNENNDEEINSLFECYKDILRWGYDKQSNNNTDHVDLGDIQELWKPINDAYSKLKNSINNLLSDIEQELEKNSSYQSIYDTYKRKIDTIFKKQDEYWNSIELNDEEQEKIKIYIENSDWNEYKKADDLSEYDNKYCIYWYQYEKDYKEPNAAAAGIMPVGWRRITLDDFFQPIELTQETYQADMYYIKKDEIYEKSKEWDSTKQYYINPTGTDKFKNQGLPNEKNQDYFVQRPAPGEATFDMMMRSDRQEEKIVAVLFYNHEKFVSNELVFINNDPIEEPRGTALIIDHGDKSQENYNIYNITNHVNNLSDIMFSRQLKCHYDGILSGDEALANGTLYWYIPNAATMLVYDKTYLISRGFATDIDATETMPYSKPGYVCFYKKVNYTPASEDEEESFENNGVDTRDFWYKINQYYDVTATKNTILCEFYPEDSEEKVVGDITFRFGIAGTSGTKYTLSITNDGVNIATSNSNANHNGSIDLLVSLTDENNKPINLVQETAEIKTPSEEYALLQVKWKWHMAMDKSQSAKELSLIPFEEGAPITNIHVPDGCCGIIEATAIINLDGTRVVELTTEYSVPWKDDGALSIENEDISNPYLSGPINIIYNSQGTLDNTNMFNAPYKIYDSNSQNEAKQSNWKLKYYNGNTEIINAGDHVKEFNFCENHIAKIQFNNGHFFLVPGPLYMSNINIIPVIYVQGFGFDIDTQEALAGWVQPILIIQNKYGSPTLNDWDGSLLIDEEKNTILSAMIGAGRKNPNNTFDGVFMGDLSAENIHEVGLYGYNDGTQSFGFKVDGTAFLGKTGKGQIIFDGNKGIIKSGNYDAESGMCIDLDDGHIDAYNFKLTSGGIQLNSNPGESDNDYYLYIGAQSAANGTIPPHISYSGSGKLKLLVDELEITNPNGAKGLLTQDNVVKALTADGAAKGIYLGEDGQLYINATYMIAGLIRSENWAGDITVRIESFDPVLGNVFEDKTFTNIKSSNITNITTELAGKQYEILDIKTTDGMYIDLNNGKIGANNFNLEAKNEGNQIIISSTPKFQMQLAPREVSVEGSNVTKWIDRELIHIDPIGSKFYLRSVDFSNESIYQGSQAVSYFYCGKIVPDNDGKTYENLRETPGGAFNSTTENVRNMGININGYIACCTEFKDNYYFIAKAVKLNSQGEIEDSQSVDLWIYYLSVKEQVPLLPTEEKIDVYSKSGTEFDVANGTLLSYGANNQLLKISSADEKYPILIGAEENPNLKIGWDGSMTGGSANTFWTLGADGRASFSYISAWGGTIGGLTINSSGIKGNGWSFDANGISMGSGQFNNSCVVVDVNGREWVVIGQPIS